MSELPQVDVTEQFVGDWEQRRWSGSVTDKVKGFLGSIAIAGGVLASGAVVEGARPELVTFTGGQSELSLPVEFLEEVQPPLLDFPPPDRQEGVTPVPPGVLKTTVSPCPGGIIDPGVRVPTPGDRLGAFDRLPPCTVEQSRTVVSARHGALSSTINCAESLVGSLGSGSSVWEATKINTPPNPGITQNERFVAMMDVNQRENPGVDLNELPVGFRIIGLTDCYEYIESSAGIYIVGHDQSGKIEDLN